MKALRWYGTGDVRVETVDDPVIEDPRDAIIKITSTAICDRTCIYITASCRQWKKGIFSAMKIWARSSKLAAT